MSLAARTSCGLLLGLMIPACSPTRGDSKAAPTQEVPVAFVHTTPGDAVSLETMAPPLVLGEPPAESAELNGESIANALPSELERLARDFAAGGNFSLAARYQYWYVKQTGVGQFNLARYYAGYGQSDASLYWLHAAAREEGVTLDDLARDDAFRLLTNDTRWPSVRSYLQTSLRGWEMRGRPLTTLILPHGYSKERGPIWVVAWFHDAGSNPTSVVDAEDEEAECRLLADTLNIAFVGISGTLPRGKKSYAWADDPLRDYERVQAALAEASQRLAIRPAGVIALGTGQGGRTAMEMAARHPEVFAGAIALSTGKQRTHLSHLVVLNPLLAQRAFVLAGSEGDASAEAAWLETTKARVTVEVLPSSYTTPLPLNFARLFPNWLRIVQSAQ